MKLFFSILHLLAAYCLLLTSPSPSLAQEKKIDLTFGRVVVDSFGVDGERVRSFVDLYDSEGRRVGGGRTEREGETYFHVHAGTYSARAIANNSVEIGSIRVVQGQETRVRADFGKLTLSLNDPGRFAAFFDAGGAQVLALGIGRTGKLSAYVKPGTYKILVHTDPRREFENLVVRANQETLAGESINHPPRIVEITSNPPLIRPGQSAKIRVDARDEDGDPLTFSYKPDGGRIEGSGERVVYHAPQGNGPQKISVTVSDSHGASDTFDYSFSSGELAVRAFTANREPFNGHVQILDRLGSTAASSGLGPEGARKWRLREGRYRLLVTGDNPIEVPDIQVTAEREHKVDVVFGRIRFKSHGPNGDPVDAAVDLFDSKGEKVRGGKAGNPGETIFNVAEGEYRATLYANNHTEITSIEVNRGKETSVRTEWGRLTLKMSEPGKYVNVYESPERKIFGGVIGDAGKLSCHVRPGIYSIVVHTEPRREFRDIVVHAGKETAVGELINSPPRIREVSSDPAIVQPGESARIRVDATDDDGDTLKYSYTTGQGRIEGKGPRVVYHAPLESGAYKVTVTVSDPAGASDTFDYFISGAELTVRAVTGRGEPFNALVQIFDRLGNRVTSENLGPSGTKTWQIRQGAYSLQVLGDSMIEVKDVEVITGRKRSIDVRFGRILIESLGVGDERIEAAVDLYDSEKRKVAGGRIGREGEISFNVAEGDYQAVLTARNEMTITGIRAIPGQTSRVKAEWGKLTLSFMDQGEYAVFYGPGGRRMIGETMAQGGRLSYHVRPGTYRIEVFSDPKREFRDLVVSARQETLAGDFANQPPKIRSVTSDPPLIKAGQSSRIMVEAYDDDGDPLTYHYEATVGAIEGSGREVVYHAPKEKGPYQVNVWVSDPHEDSPVYGHFISGGDLTIRTLSGRQEPLDTLVHIYNQLGTRVRSGNVGTEGTKTWMLPEGAYRIEVIGDNTIELSNVNVVTDLDATAVVHFGKLTVQCFGPDKQPLRTYVLLKTGDGEKAADGRTAEDGVIHFSLRPGTYDIFAHQSNTIERLQVQVESQQQYMIAMTPSESGVTANASNRPAIEQIVLKPLRTEGPRVYQVSVTASGAGRLSYEHECDGAEVTGMGPTATIRGKGSGAITLRVTVRAESGGEARGEVRIPALKEKRS